MSRAIALMGESGSGKTTSLRTLDPKDTYYIDCDGKGLNWKGWRKQYNAENKNYMVSDNQADILARIENIATKGKHIHNIVIDTINSIMVADERRRINEKGYDKWSDLAWAVYDICVNASRYRDDLNIIVLAHVQVDTDEVTGEKFCRILTNGKKLNKIGLEKYFSTVLYSKCVDGKYIFETKANNSTAKTPFGAFESDTIPNDMAAVLKALEDF